jgi:hypothetical protein
VAKRIIHPLEEVDIRYHNAKAVFMSGCQFKSPIGKLVESPAVEHARQRIKVCVVLQSLGKATDLPDHWAENEQGLNDKRQDDDK